MLGLPSSRPQRTDAALGHLTHREVARVIERCVQVRTRQAHVILPLHSLRRHRCSRPRRQQLGGGRQRKCRGARLHGAAPVQHDLIQARHLLLRRRSARGVTRRAKRQPCCKCKPRSGGSAPRLVQAAARYDGAAGDALRVCRLGGVEWARERHRLRVRALGRRRQRLFLRHAPRRAVEVDAQVPHQAAQRHHHARGKHQQAYQADDHPVCRRGTRVAPARQRSRGCCGHRGAPAMFCCPGCVGFGK